jgi:hypothetical protein
MPTLVMLRGPVLVEVEDVVVGVEDTVEVTVVVETEVRKEVWVVVFVKFWVSVTTDTERVV